MNHFRAVLVIFGLVIASIMGFSAPAIADTTPILSGSSWFGGSGVNVCGASTDTACGGQTHVGGVSSNWWQCVELAQRFYQTKGWYSGIFSGVSIAADIYTQAAPTGTLSGMTRQTNGSITSIVPGDMIVHATTEPGSSGAGHVSIVDSVNGSTVNVVEENGPTSNGRAVYSFSTGTLSRGSGVWTSVILGVVHSPSNHSTGGARVTYQTAFQANNSNLYTFDSSSGPLSTDQGMLNGTSPSITAQSTGSYEEAFQANNGDLYLAGSNGNYSTQQGMAAWTNPSIAGSSNSFMVAFQTNVGGLYTFSSTSGTANTGLSIRWGTSPSITRLSTGGYEIAYHTISGYLALYGSAGTFVTTQGMLDGTSPSIASNSSGGYRVAFQANTGYLFTYDSTDGAVNTTQGMAAWTSPSIAYTTSGYEEAFQANTGNLFVAGSAGSYDTQQGMESSPSISAPSSGGFVVAFQTNTHYLYLFTSTSGTVPTTQGMASGSSPSIATN